MKLKIGDNTWNIDYVGADFPITFYQKTGLDIFKAELNIQKEPMVYYTAMLNMAHILSKEECSLEEFSKKFTPNELVLEYEQLASIYTGAAQPKVESKGKKK